MAAVIVEIADAVTDALNAASFTPSFTAARAYVPTNELPDLDTPTVLVVPRELSSVVLTRSTDDFTYIVGISIQRRFDPPGDPDAVTPPTVANIDTFMALTESVIDLFRGKRLTGYSAAMCTAVENAPIYSPIELDGSHVFSTIILLTFKVARNQT